MRTAAGVIHGRGAPLKLDAYLQVFDRVIMFARVEDVGDAKLSRFRLDNPRVDVFPLPCYRGPWQYLRSLFKLRALARQAACQADAFMLRVPGVIGTVLWRELRRRKLPYGVEVVGDPWDVFAPGTVETPLRLVLRRKFSRELALQCRRASVAAYVTQYSLQRRYPPGAWTTHYSSVNLPCTVIVGENIVRERIARLKAKIATGSPRRLCCIGSLEQMYKAPDVLIHAVAACVSNGLNLRLSFVGEGVFQPRLERQAADLGIGDRVSFRGVLSKEEVFQELDETDLYVLPSRTEGLPRTIVEAMARGVPCIATRVGGVPELLPDENLVPPGDTHALAHKISRVIDDTDAMQEMALRNLQTAARYAEEEVDRRRKLCYEKLLEVSRSHGTRR